MRTPTTRTAALAVLVTAAALGASACGSSPPAAAPAPAAAPQATGVQEFVGPAGSDGAFYVAIALTRDGTVEAYVCDGTGQAENFQGTATGDRIQLTSEDGDSTLTATTTADAVDGSVVIAGLDMPFTAPRTEGVGGLYDFDVARQGDRVVFTGTSRGGNVATAEITGPQTADGTITATNGATAPLEAMQGQSPDAVNDFDAYRVVITDDGTRRGNPKPGARKITGGGGSFTCPILFG